MIISVIGSGGKTTKIKQLKDQYLKEGKSVLMTTSTHMKIEEKTLVDPSYEEIINEIKIIIDEIRKGNLFPKSNINPASKEPVTCPTAFEELKIPMSEP